MWARTQARRAFMIESLGIRLHESVPPMGNTPGWLTPYAMAPGAAMVQR